MTCSLLAISMTTGDAFACKTVAYKFGFHSILACALQRVRATPNASARKCFLRSTQQYCGIARLLQTCRVALAANVHRFQTTMFLHLVSAISIAMATSGESLMSSWFDN